MINLQGLKVEELYNLQSQLAYELQRRNTQQRDDRAQKQQEFLSSPEAAKLKAEIAVLDAEYATLPKKVYVGKTINLKLVLDMDIYDTLGDLLECGDEIGMLSLELDDPGSLPDELASSLQNSLEDMDFDMPIQDFLKDSYDGRQWESFIQKSTDLQNRLDVLYTHGVSVDDLIES